MSDVYCLECGCGEDEHTDEVDQICRSCGDELCPGFIEDEEDGDDA